MRRILVLVFSALIMLAPHPRLALAQSEPPLDDPDLSHEEISPADEPDPAKIADMAAAVHQVPLSEDMITRFLASYSEMQAVARKFPTPPSPDKDKMQQAQAAVDLNALTPEKRDAMNAVATKYGFTDVADWAGVGSSIAMSYAYALQGKQPGAVGESIEQHIAAANKDPKLTEDQKQDYIAKLRGIGADLAKLEPTPENFALVQKLKDKIAPIMNFE